MSNENPKNPSEEELKINLAFPVQHSHSCTECSFCNGEVNDFIKKAFRLARSKKMNLTINVAIKK